MKYITCDINYYSEYSTDYTNIYDLDTSILEDEDNLWLDDEEQQELPGILPAGGENGNNNDAKIPRIIDIVC